MSAMGDTVDYDSGSDYSDEDAHIGGGDWRKKKRSSRRKAVKRR